MRLFEMIVEKNRGKGLSLKSALQKAIDTHLELHEQMLERAALGEKIYFDRADQSEFSDFNAAVKAISIKENITLAAAVRKCATNYPGLHRQYVARLMEAAANE